MKVKAHCDVARPDYELAQALAADPVQRRRFKDQEPSSSMPGSWSHLCWKRLGPKFFHNQGQEHAMSRLPTDGGDMDDRPSSVGYSIISCVGT